MLLLVAAADAVAAIDADDDNIRETKKKMIIIIIIVVKDNCKQVWIITGLILITTAYKTFVFEINLNVMKEQTR